MCSNKYLWGAALPLLLLVACGQKRVASPPPLPPAKQNVFALLPEKDVATSGIIVKNQGGTQELTQPYQAVRVERADIAPTSPFLLDQAEVTRLFGAALDVVPAPEAQFVLHFDEGRDVLNAASQAQIPAILAAIRDRHSTAITVTGHTDTTADHDFNYRLGMRRAQNVADILKSQGVKEGDLFVSSHGDADLLVKTGPNQAEAQNRRVEVIVR